jgi:trk system potassium uptake protein TrkA
MQAMGNEVVGVDSNRAIIQGLAGDFRQVVEADATSETALRDLGVSNLDGAVVAIRDPEPSIMATLLLKKLGVPYLVARATSSLHEEILKLAGADRVVFPEQEMALRLAHEVAIPEVVDYLSITTDMGINKLKVPQSLLGKTYREAALENRFRIRIMATIRRDTVTFGTGVSDRFEPGDILIVSGRDVDLRRFAAFAGRTE